MPMQRSLYPADWEAISLRMRERAQWRCEACGVAQGVEVIGASGKPYDIVLTVAHLNHDPSDCREENLRAWCQPCHLRYDVEHHARNRARHRVEAQVEAGQLALWDAPGVDFYHRSPHPPASRDVDEVKRIGRQRRRAAQLEDYEASTPVATPPEPPQPLRTKPLVWGKWPAVDEPLVIEGDTDDTITDSARRWWVFVREMACGKELLGVLLAPWEQRSERERVAQRWVAIERVRRVVTDENEVDA